MPAQRFRSFLITYLRPLWLRSGLLLILLFVNVGLRLLNPLILAAVVDGYVVGVGWQPMLRLALAFVAVALLLQVVVVAEAYLAAYIGLTATNVLRADLAAHCLRLDLAFHNNRTPGEMIERVDGDVGRLNNFFSRFTVDLAGNVLLVLGVLIALLRIDWRVALALGSFAALTLITLIGIRNVAVPAFRAMQEANAALFGFLEERLAGTEEIRANGGTDYVLFRFFERTRVQLRTRLRAVLLGAGAFHFGNFLFTLGTIVALALGVYLFQTSIITLGTVYVIYRYSEMLAQPLQEISRQFQDLQQAGAAALRIFELLDAQPAIHDHGSADPGPGALAVDFDRVHFQYRDSAQMDSVLQPASMQDGAELTAPAPRPTVDNILFQLPAGAKLGLLGRTGSGKTTLTRLLLRLYEPDQGAIRIGGMPLPSICLEALRRRVTMVTQEVQLFHASVRDNLTLFRPGISDERIAAVLDEIGLGDWRMSLANGLDTMLAPAGSNLSSGQAQLLAFARVFLHDPGVVVLDEASSRLDPATEQTLTQVMERLLAGRTAIIIAHRLATIQRADYIMIMEAGTCVEFGLRADLQHDPSSRFSMLMRTGLEEVTV
jgi:ATP-binding cassette subfamily B protein/ATP-binding cassette subfamily C protein